MRVDALAFVLPRLSYYVFVTTFVWYAQCADHSLDLAWQVCRCPRMMETLRGILEEPQFNPRTLLLALSLVQVC